MTILRPYNAEDNKINTEMRDIIEKYLKKNDEVINTIKIFGCTVEANTQSGREISITKAEGCMARTVEKRNYFYMKERVNGKWKRIKKEEW